MTNTQHWIGLLRGIGPTTHAKMPLAALCRACEATGLGQVRSLLATGNLVFQSPLPEGELTKILCRVVAGFDLDNPTFLRGAPELRKVLALNPMPAAAQVRPHHMLVLFLDHPPPADRIAAVTAHGGPEPVQVHGREVYIDFLDSVGRSKLTPARLERLLGQPGTARNWNTLVKLAAAAA
ncbi:DUF1697 domain-containing protein [Paracoccus sp. S1E-3]|uniref:DUF1697 domain-containing protein n=1 Tax=Paracoccus sp. S1E-3 TaxID=2756130 RepID=UPI0015EEBBBB|nr:DUF1697 domain-containing protein [Paracoccus sp. S1E-3]MBA4490012.1 DUF1697 domain-containing protein [Paracoccus sp. S1E-3]